jgi:hypothetical protein
MTTEVIREPTVLGHPDVVGEAEGQERPRRARRLPLLLEDVLELGSREVDGPDVVDERQDRVGLRVGHHAVGVGRVAAGVTGVAQVGPQATRVDHAEVGRALVGGQPVAQGVGDQVAERRLGAAVVAGAADPAAVDVRPAAEGGGDVPGDRAHRLVADLGRLGERGVHDPLDLRHPRVGGDQVRVGRGRAGHVAGRVRRDRLGDRVDGQLDLADVVAVLARLDDRAGPGGVIGDGRVPGVRLVRVAVEDDVHLRVEARHLRELAALGHLGRVAGAHALGGAGVEAGHDHVGLAVGGVAVAQLARDPVDRVDGVAEVEVADAAGADQ